MVQVLALLGRTAARSPLLRGSFAQPSVMPRNDLAKGPCKPNARSTMHTT